jgi:hydroxymethylbilane synthase
MKRIIIGTRASKLAMIQTQWVVERLKQQEPAPEIAIEHIHTTGDAITHIPLTEIGNDGVFVMEIERALLEGRIDLAVHSLKDLPTTQPQGLSVIAAGVREDPRDVLIVNSQLDQTWDIESQAVYCTAGACPRPDYPHPESSRSGSGTAHLRPHDALPALRIGTCSLRRTAQIRALFPEVEILPLRGNVDTRLRKLDAGDYDAIVLAAAGLHRLGIHERLAVRMNYLSVEMMMPAPGQGALALEMRDEPEARRLVAPLGNPVTQATTSAERIFMRRLGAGCYLPVGAHGEITGETLILRGLVISLDGQQQVHVQESMPWTPETPVERAEQLGVQLAERALTEGAAEIIDTLHVTRFGERQHA